MIVKSYSYNFIDNDKIKGRDSLLKIVSKMIYMA